MSVAIPGSPSLMNGRLIEGRVGMFMFTMRKPRAGESPFQPFGFCEYEHKKARRRRRMKRKKRRGYA